MKTDFQYSTDFLAMNAPELGHTCMHLLCTAGEGSFVFNEKFNRRLSPSIFIGTITVGSDN